MTIPDLINGSFEMLGGLFILNNCRVLYRDKMVKGVSITSTVFFASWGAWNTYFYRHLDQWASFCGGLVIFGANLLWIALMIHYYNKDLTKVNF
jgi:hypothetical protein